MFVSFRSLLRSTGLLCFLALFSLQTQNARAQLLDYNLDGVVDQFDLDELVSRIGNPAIGFPEIFMDLDGDGIITMGTPAEAGSLIGDGNNFLHSYAILTGASAAYLRGDHDLNGVVDGNDFLAWKRNRFQSGLWSQGDFNGDGVVDGPDAVLLFANLFQTNL